MYFFATIVKTLVGFINSIIGVLEVGSMFVFFYGIVRYISVSGNEKKLPEAKSFLVWGLIALFVLFSIWGIIGIACKTFIGVTCNG